VFESLDISCKKEIIYGGYTALDLATLWGTLDSVKRLLQVPGIDVNAGSNFSSNPAFNAAQNGNLQMLRLLVDSGADLDNRGGKKVDNVQETILIIGVSSGSVPVVKYLLSKGVNIEERGIYSYTPLGNAVWYGYNEIVKILVEAGADSNQLQDNDEWTMLMLALYRNNTDIVPYLISLGIDVNAVNKNGWTALYYSAIYSGKEEAEALISAGAFIDARNGEYNRTSLHEAVLQNNTDVALYLISKGADVNLKDSENFTPVYAAVNVGDRLLLEALVEAGADLNVQDGERKWSPMMLAAYDGNYEIVKFLKNLGVNLDLVSDAGYTALDFAEEQNHADVVKLLKEK